MINWLYKTKWMTVEMALVQVDKMESLSQMEDRHHQAAEIMDELSFLLRGKRKKWQWIYRNRRLIGRANRLGDIMENEFDLQISNHDFNAAKEQLKKICWTGC